MHDRHDFALRLWHSPRWARELLGVTGVAPALSAVPRTHRPLPEVELVGRAADLRWLRETQGHRLVVGQPGSGKTALLMQLVTEGHALFLASDDEARVAEACRELAPKIILADDAHLDPEKLTRLRQMRAEVGADFEIVATTWPGAEDDVADALGGLGRNDIRHLELLTRAEIVQVLRLIGVPGPDDDPYLRELVDQSANKPGLAVTLGSLWLRGEGIAVHTGKALQRSLIPALKRILEHDPTQLLACFALGGDRGVSIESVAKFLELGLGEAHDLTAHASQGGVLSVHRGQLLSVQPEALRWALLAKMFFSPRALRYRLLLEDVPDRGAAVAVLFPLSDHFKPGDWQAAEKQQTQAARQLAKRWISKPPLEAAQELASYSAEAQGFMSLESEASRAFFQTLANAISSPTEWLGVKIAEDRISEAEGRKRRFEQTGDLISSYTSTP